MEPITFFLKYGDDTKKVTGTTIASFESLSEVTNSDYIRWQRSCATIPSHHTQPAHSNIRMRACVTTEAFTRASFGGSTDAHACGTD